jgi:hypothetical protein
VPFGLAAIRAGAPPTIAFMAFGADMDEARQHPRQIARAYAESMARMAAEVARESPVDWFKNVYPQACSEIREFTTAFGQQSVLESPAVCALLSAVADFMKDNLTSAKYEEFQLILKQRS